MIEPRKAGAFRKDRGRQANAPRRRAAAIAAAVASAVLCAGLAGTLLRPRSPLLLWNASPSSPVGLYAIGPPARLRAGDTAIAWPPPEARRLAARRHYLPVNVPLVKPVEATLGARVCAVGDRIFVNGRQVAIRLFRDASGRRLPWWLGCIWLREGDVFLLSPGVPDAYDGRYFGITRASEIIGKARLLWRR
jgi:type IV secretory pathway protease TraF